MKRWHEEENLINSRLKDRQRICRSVGSDGTIKEDTSKRSCQRGRYRKQDAYDCGNPQCGICHYDKVHGIKAPKDIKADISFKEQREAI